MRENTKAVFLETLCNPNYPVLEPMEQSLALVPIRNLSF
ncbi:hypothetical protein [Hominifimenecus sp. rT4P-3]